MEVIQWTKLWEFFKDEYENEKNFLGGALGTKAAEDLKLRIIEHVLFTWLSLYGYLVLPLCLSINISVVALSRISWSFRSTIRGLP